MKAPPPCGPEGDAPRIAGRGDGKGRGNDDQESSMDTRTLRRKVNEVKAKAEEHRGPAGHSQEDAPLLDALRRFHAEDTLSLAIPAHKSGAGAPDDVLELLGEAAFRADQTMLNGVDNRHESWQVQTAAQELAAEALGADQCLFSTNGSTASVHSAISAVVGPGEKLAVSRNAHKSVITGLIHAGAVPVWLEAEYDEDLDVAHGVTPDTVRRALAEHPDCKAVMIVSPSYYGVCSRVPDIAEIAHGHGIPLVSDDAWALAYKFHPELPEFALDAGADLAIGSVHKTLSGLSQTSIISVKGDRIDTVRLSLALETYETTSGSSLLLASIDAARRQMVQDGERLLGEALRLARRLRAGAQALGYPTIEPDDILRRASAWAFNELHVTLDVRHLGLTGYKAADWLRGHEAVAVELADHRRVMACVTHADSDDSIDRALSAFEALAHGGPRFTRASPSVPSPTELRTKQVMTPQRAFYADVEMVPIDRAGGRIAAEFVTPYPPGIPLVVPGERINEAIVDYLKTGAADGIYAEGCADQSLSELRVVA
ncbi:aminotransferase class I/II-fold pyridoxal phosphate-dependent enzyme [Candidatus Solirubrobacter pratensis]|uniref:aminotransferase class I/II-fold pyridoxal phosphate-dependent enzyme n=1 Tax=Candidatus Solirubrobacter pratensis TaxID=1298857 RepID=UPI000416546C|nr:DegT/DnrJ/EryC1/StrS family aminotransferase [Candidatus Solirubrobacter pratensis]